MEAVANIERVLSLATANEIADGLVAYHMQHGIARVLHAVYDLESVAHAAGIIAPLSPMNNWDDNVTDAFAVCRWRPETGAPWPTVRTTTVNLAKAIEIRKGTHPEAVLRGRKVTAFYMLTAAPDIGSMVPVDRHLAAAAVGRSMSDHETTRLLARAYDEIEQSYKDVGRRHGVLGWQVAGVVWYAWRRMKSAGTIGQRLLATVDERLEVAIG